MILLAGEAGLVKQLAESPRLTFLSEIVEEKISQKSLFSHAFHVMHDMVLTGMHVLTSPEAENYGVILVQIWTLVIHIYFYWVFRLFPCIFSFYKSWILSHIVNPIKSYVKFAPFGIVWWLLQKWFLLFNKLKGSVPGSAGLLNDTIEDLLIMWGISSISFNQETAIGRGDR